MALVGELADGGGVGMRLSEGEIGREAGTTVGEPQKHGRIPAVPQGGMIERHQQRQIICIGKQLAPPEDDASGTPIEPRPIGGAKLGGPIQLAGAKCEVIVQGGHLPVVCAA